MGREEIADNDASLDRAFMRIGRELGSDIAEVIVLIFAEEIGGVRLTFPDRRGLERQARNLIIRSSFNGANIDELALQHDLSPSQIRRILAKK